MNYYRVPKLWVDETVFILGGGPSLKGVDLSVLVGRRTIAINNAYRLLPNPDVIFYADTRWWGWNGKDIPESFTGRIISTCSAGAHYLPPSVLRMRRDYRYDERHYPAETRQPISDEPQSLSGPDSGYMAINLAYLHGASRIVLLGFDMGFTAGETHWHEDHPVPSEERNYTDLFLPRYPALLAALRKRDVEVVRCTPSRLTGVPEIALAEALALPARHRRSPSLFG